MAGNGFTLGGDPMAIATSGVQWQTFATRACDAAAELRSVVQASYGFDGDEGDTLRTRIDLDAAAGLDLAAQAWQMVGGALIRYATQLDSCQAQLRSLGATATAQRSQMAALSSVAASGSPSVTIELQQTLRRTVAGADSVHVEHAAALRDCTRAIDVAAALAPAHPPGVRGLLASSFTAVEESSAGGTNVLHSAGGTNPVRSMAGLLRIAAIGSTQVAAVGLHGSRVTFASPDDSGGPPPVQGTTAEIETRLYENCLADQRLARGPTDASDQAVTNALDDENVCRSFAQSAISDPQAMQEALVIYPWADGVRTPKPQGWAAFAEGVGDFVEAVAVVVGVDDCLDGDAAGCGAQAGMFLLGPIGKGLQKIGRALKFGRDVEEAGDVATRAAKAIADLPPAAVSREVVHQRLNEWPDIVAVTKAGQKPVPEDWFPVVATKIPDGWNLPKRGKLSKDLDGKTSLRFEGPNGDSVRIDIAMPGSRFPSQHVEHVTITSRGKPVTRSGGTAKSKKDDDAWNTHTPMAEWKGWSTWNHP